MTGRALIIGGSLGGQFAALLLRQAGWDVTVFERSTGDLARRGVGIGTHVEMFDIVRRLGITADESIGQSFSSRFCLAREGAVIARLRPHVGAGVTKAALNAAWLTDALSATINIDAALARYEAQARAFGAVLVARARYLGAYLEDPPRVGLTPEPVTLMQSIGVPLRDIPEVALCGSTITLAPICT